jgi:hypothetical protein
MLIYLSPPGLKRLKVDIFYRVLVFFTIKIALNIVVGDDVVVLVQGQGKIDGWGRDRFVDRDAFTEENGYFLNDTIIFTVEIVVYGEIEHHCTFSRNGFTLDQDICSLFHQKINTDLIIKVTGKRFHLHKCILAARSPVFQAMFSK